MEKPEFKRIVLNKVEDTPKSMFQLANGFHSAYGFLAGHMANHVRQDSRFMRLAFPQVVCSAFAAEIYLKCLYRIETGNKIWGHPLLYLFNALKEENRIIVEANYQKVLKEDSTGVLAAAQKDDQNLNTDLKENLRIFSSAFEKWRYAYEGGLPSPFFIPPFTIAIRDRILSIEPSFDKQD